MLEGEVAAEHGHQPQAVCLVDVSVYIVQVLDGWLVHFPRGLAAVVRVLVDGLDKRAIVCVFHVDAWEVAVAATGRIG